MFLYTSSAGFAAAACAYTVEPAHATVVATAKIVCKNLIPNAPRYSTVNVCFASYVCIPTASVIFTEIVYSPGVVFASSVIPIVAAT